MGKKQHQSDKLYLTAKEWKDIGGHKDGMYNFLVVSFFDISLIILVYLMFSRYWNTYKESRVQEVAIQSLLPFTLAVRRSRCFTNRRNLRSHVSSSLWSLLCVVYSHIYRAIVPYLKKYGVNPCTGAKMTVKDLIALKLNKNELGTIYSVLCFPVILKLLRTLTEILTLKMLIMTGVA